MPPKDVIQGDLLAPRDVCVIIKGFGEAPALVIPHVEFKAIPVVCEPEPDPAPLYKNLTLSFNIKHLESPFNLEELRLITRQMLGYSVGKRPKLTYKTLRHDCAKRNGRR